ncbi:hypothetical protein [Spiribacter onubensis]|uniref:Uncharacterized protein n=1 Tax=Spiribacter onubensis TaxID=3122420 RepID=A0ABV3S892_9GAMM
MQEQFLLIADELGWDLEAQIERLDEFVRVYGAAGRMDAELAGIGLSVRQRLHRESLRDAMLNFIARLGAQGAFSHYLHGQMRRAREAVAPGVASEPSRSPEPVGVGGRRGLRTAIRRWMTTRGRGPSQTLAS